MIKLLLIKLSCMDAHCRQRHCWEGDSPYNFPLRNTYSTFRVIFYAFFSTIEYVYQLIVDYIYFAYRYKYRIAGGPRRGDASCTIKNFEGGTF